MEKLRVGVVGCGLIAQVMHLNYLRELSDRYEIAALCDLDESLREACARDYGVAKTFGGWQELLQEKLDAVLVLTPAAMHPLPSRRRSMVSMCWSRSRCASPWGRARR